HDLDEAIRIGDQIAIMKDGEICQIGTPAEIVGRPANDYVAQFVRNISRLHLITAGEIARPLAPQAERPAQSVAASASLAEVIDLLARDNESLAVTTEGAAPAVICARDVL